MEKITGYRTLSQHEIDLVNQIKAKGEEVGILVNGLKAFGLLDQRWVAIGHTELQQGFMALVRAVTKPTGF